MPVNKLWSILILTMPTRTEFLARLLGILQPQVNGHHEIEILIRICDPAYTLGENREMLRRSATGTYLNFLDDDDRIPKDFVATILPLLDGVDIIGFECALTWDGVPDTKRDFHTISTSGWYSDETSYHRDLSHLQPIRRELALAAPMEGGHGEDGRWADKMRALGIVKTEHYIDRVMYFYEYRSGKNRGAICPHCGRDSTVMVEEGTHCNACGRIFNPRPVTQKSCLWF